MSNDGIIQIINNKVGAILALLAKQNSTVDSISTSDFIVDMFDRNDADNLGEYWDTATGFAIRDSVCVPNEMSGLTSFKETNNYSYSKKVYKDFAGDALPKELHLQEEVAAKDKKIPDCSSQVVRPSTLFNRHKSKLSKKSFICKITFNLNESIFQSDTRYIDIPSEVGIGIYGIDASSMISFNFFSVQRTNDFFQDTLVDFNLENIYTANNSYYTKPFSYQVLVPEYGTLNTFISGNLFITDKSGSVIVYKDADDEIISEDVSASSITYVDVYSATTGNFVGHTYEVTLEVTHKYNYFQYKSNSPYQIGENVAELIIDDNNLITVIVNGVTWASKSSQLVIDRAYVGLNFPSINGVGLIEAYGKSIGISSIKAWVDGTPEPPDETGFGVYDKDNIDFYYRDKYHKRIEDVDTGEVVGFDYDPLA